MKEKGMISKRFLLKSITPFSNNIVSNNVECQPNAPVAQLAEQLTLNQLRSAINPEKNANSATDAPYMHHIELTMLVERWDSLSPETKQAIIELVENDELTVAP